MTVILHTVFVIKMLLCLKAKVYFTLYAYARDSVQCAWREFRHTRIVCADRTCALISLAVISCSGNAAGGGIDSQGSQRKTYGFTHLRNKFRRCPACSNTWSCCAFRCAYMSFSSSRCNFHNCSLRPPLGQERYCNLAQSACVCIRVKLSIVCKAARTTVRIR